jgi:hypothetical protein
VTGGAYRVGVIAADYLSRPEGIHQDRVGTEFEAPRTVRAFWTLLQTG